MRERGDEGVKKIFLFQHHITRTSAGVNFVARSSPTQLFATCAVQADVFHNLLKICTWVMNLACAITGNGIWLHLLVPLLVQCCFFDVSC